MPVEYHAISADKLPSPEQLARFADEGWRLVQMVKDVRGDAGQPGLWVLYLERDREG